MKVLFLCVANSARSQIAEGLAKKILGPTAIVESAGSAPTQVNSKAKQVLEEIGVDVSGLRSKALGDLPKTFLDELDYVVTLCAEEICPAFVAPKAKRLHWPLPDPGRIGGDPHMELLAFRAVREEIRKRLEQFPAGKKG